MLTGSLQSYQGMKRSTDDTDYTDEPNHQIDPMVCAQPLKSVPKVCEIASLRYRGSVACLAKAGKQCLRDSLPRERGGEGWGGGAIHIMPDKLSKQQKEQ